MKRLTTLIAALACATTAGLAGPAAAATKIVEGVTAPIGLFWPSFVANKRGFLEKNGIQSELNIVGEVSLQVQQVIGGSLDVTWTTCEVTSKAIEKGADIKIIGETVRLYPYSFMTPQTVKTAKDMIGKKVILAAQRDLITATWERWLRENGVDPKQVDQIYDGATPNRYNALANGAAQAAVVSQPFDFRAKAEGYNELMNFSNYMQNVAFVCAAAQTGWGKKNPALAKAYLKAYAEAVDWLYDPKNKEDAITVLQEISKQDRGLITKTYDYFFTELKPYMKGVQIDRQGMEKMMQLMRDFGDLKTGLTVDQVIDASYLPAQ